MLNSDTTLQPVADAATDQGPQPTTDERLSAVTREAVETIETGIDPLQAEEPEAAEEVGEPLAEEAETEAGEPGEDAEGQMEAGESESQEDEESTAPDKQGWDGDLDSLPAEQRAPYDHWVENANKGLHKRLRQMSDVEKKYKDATFRYEQAMLQMQQQPQGGVPKEDGPPAPPTGENTTQKDWADHEARVAEYHNKRLNSETTQKLAVLEERQSMQDRLQLVASQDGVTDEIMFRMSEMAKSDQAYADLFQTDQGALQFFGEAKLAVEREAFEAEKTAIAATAAKSTVAEAKRKAGASGRATPRPGGTKAASAPEDVFARKTFRSVDDKMSHLVNEVKNEHGL